MFAEQKTGSTSEIFFHWKKLDNRRCHLYCSWETNIP